MHLHELVFQPSDWDFGYLSPICSFMYGLLLEDPFLSFPGILYSIDFFSFYFLIALVWRKNQRLWKVFGIGQSRIAEVHLKAGDLFYLPIFWWHAVQGSIGRNMILNWWCQQHPYKEHLPWCPPWLIHQTVLGQWTSTKLWCLKKVAEILGLELQDT